MDVETTTEIPAEVDPRVVKGRGKLLKLGPHWFFSRDADAGTRSYGHGAQPRRFWHGYLTQTVVDHYTQQPLAIHVFGAHKQENHEYAKALAMVKEATGALPLIAAGDRGYSIKAVYRLNTESGVASVFPHMDHRAHTPQYQPKPTDPWDVHGVPLCVGCGMPTDYIRFRRETRGNSIRTRVEVRCVLPTTPACDGVKVVTCARDWKRMLPLWRTHKAYQAMRHSHIVHEFKHEQLRLNYRVGANNPETRPHRASLGLLQMRAHCAVLIEWLRFLLRRGTLDPPRETSVGDIRQGVTARRARLGLWGGQVATDSRAGP